MMCKNCGTVYSEGMVFCTNCGADLRSASSATGETSLLTAVLVPRSNEQENYGQKIKLLSNVIFGLSVFCAICFLLISIVTSIVLATEVFGSDNSLIILGGLLTGIVTAGITVAVGYIFKILIYGYGIIVASHEKMKDKGGV